MHEAVQSVPGIISPASIKHDTDICRETLQQPVYLDSLDYFPIQPKLSLGAVDDPLEHEADAMADLVMRMPETSFIQRKCAHCEEEEKLQRKPIENRPAFMVENTTHLPETSFIQRKCSHCEEEEKIQRKAVAPFIQSKQFSENASAGVMLSRQIDSGKGKGSSMDDSTKGFMENRFGSDFSNIKIHTGNESVQMSQSLNAKAFTVGNHIYFNEGQYEPASESGKHLLAHELTHTLQQAGVSNARVQRKVSPRINKIRDHLTYGFFDWAVTDADVRSALQDLKNLSDQDLKDTVANLEKDGLINRLYDNLQESDDRDKGWVVTIMMRIQQFRVHSRSDKSKFVGSCDVEEIKKTQGRLKTVVEWAHNCVKAVNNFISGLPGHKAIGQMLERYFFHEAQAGLLVPQQRETFAGQIKTRLNNLITGAPTTLIDCASPFDQTCTGGALAYVSGGTTMRMCASYFRNNNDKQVSILFHELMHRYNGDVNDTGYNWERVFEYLPPDRAIGNADSYSTFAEEVNLTKRLSNYTDADSFQGCDPKRQQDLRRDMAFAMRMKEDAWNEISSVDFNVQNSNNAASTHFKATGHDDLIRFSKRLSGLHLSNIEFHCDTSPTLTATLPYTSGQGLHLTRPYFNIASENQRILTLLAILFKKYVGDMDTPVWLSSPAYATQTIDQAYKNPAAFAGYIKDISIRPAGSDRSEWNFADATTRYGEALSRITEGIGYDLAAQYPDDSFKAFISNGIPDFLAQDLKMPIQNNTELQSRIGTIRSRISVTKIFLDIMYRDYPSLHDLNLRSGLFLFPGAVFFESKLDNVIDANYYRALRLLNQSFIGKILTRIKNNEILKFEAWDDYNALLADYQTESGQTLRIMETYKPYLQQLHTIKEKYKEFEHTLQKSDAVQNLELDDFILAETNFMQNETTFKDEVARIEMYVRLAIRDNRKYSRRDPDLPNLEQLLRRYQAQLRKASHPARHKK